MSDFESVNSAREDCALAIEGYLRDEISHFALEERIEEIGGTCEGAAQDFFLSLALSIEHLGCDFHHSDWRATVRDKRAEDFERIRLFLRSGLPFEVSLASSAHSAGLMGLLLSASIGVVVAWILVPPMTASWKAFAVAGFMLAWGGVFLWALVADWLLPAKNAAHWPFASMEQYQEHRAFAQHDPRAGSS
jgi:hypothetical protein